MGLSVKISCLVPCLVPCLVSCLVPCLVPCLVRMAGVYRMLDDAAVGVVVFGPLSLSGVSPVLIGGSGPPISSSVLLLRRLNR
ncbi:uncharacterized protein Nmag_1901 [Natrialba magadii ATCC 43099]|uniref:Uncharacterized protein n=1 Tax=Natrialba magadii (strain ATCC 43099 / DSM 3394 / CCM 3739 / CIP 104546 / IAM 13178 / JCM 8861 / NBRC 102185 / NCIMB 2190 / MS3) TaxID=547559 RepID=D3SV64_NATMM|nr:uncharacterized protein Nmag_1901 [Natrialba magadii ATCC 43099]